MDIPLNYKKILIPIFLFLCLHLEVCQKNKISNFFLNTYLVYFIKFNYFDLNNYLHPHSTLQRHN